MMVKVTLESHRSFALMEGECLIVKGAEEVEYAETNFKYRDKVIGQRLGNFV